VVLQSQQHAALLGRLQALAQAVDDPRETVLVRVALDRRLDAALLHELIEVLACPPGAGVHAHGRDAELVGQLDAVDRVIDVALAHGLVG
jgi:hypothetical protein